MTYLKFGEGWRLADAAAIISRKLEQIIRDCKTLTIRNNAVACRNILIFGGQIDYTRKSIDDPGIVCAPPGTHPVHIYMSNTYSQNKYKQNSIQSDQVRQEGKQAGPPIGK
jgi:hypothetical protein